jgi:hypothetical protein
MKRSSEREMKKDTLQAPPLSHLSFLLGKWHVEGTVYGYGESPSINLHGSDIYEWAAGGAFIMHRLNVRAGNDERIEILEMIGVDSGDSNSYIIHSFDSHGNIEQLTASMDTKGLIRITGTAIRALLIVKDDLHEMVADWQFTDNFIVAEEGKSWKNWMQIRFRRP